MWNIGRRLLTGGSAVGERDTAVRGDAAVHASGREPAPRSGVREKVTRRKTTRRKAVRKQTPTKADASSRRRAASGKPAASASRTRATAADLAKKQRDISVSEFFAKNRHLLGFDNPAKALLTTVKEAVDNSLDACEEAGHPAGRAGRRSARSRRTASASRSRTTARASSSPDPEDLRQAALRLEVPPLAPEPRPAGHRHLRRGHVRAADHRQARDHHLPHGGQATRPTTSSS